MERVDSHVFSAVGEALSKDEVETLYNEIRTREPLSEYCNDLVTKVNGMVRNANEDILRYDVDINNPKVIPFDTIEGMQTEKKSDHVTHIGNILQEPVVKLTAIVIVSSRDDVQGGELAFKHWPDYPRVDNYGKVIKEGENHQPSFTNEQGTLIVYPSTEPVGAQLCISGRVKRLKFCYSGKRFR